MRACIRIPDEPYHGARRIYTMIRAPQGFSVCVIFVCLLTVIYGVNVVEKCSKGCRERLATEENFDVVCSSECKLEWCKDGCKKWTLAVSDSCQETCNGSRANSNDANGKTLYCAMGCNLAIYLYVTKLKGEIGKPPPPYLVGNSRTNESVIIEWSKEPFYHNITYLVQWKYHSIPGSWEYYKPMKEPISTSRVVVHGLHPYTKYKFRVAWVILPQYSPLFSEESVIISTLPYGVPSPSPLINTLTALGPTRIAVSWDPPLFPNGPIVSYVLYLREQPSGIPSVKDISGSGNQLYYIFTNLHPNTSYQVSVATINNMGEGPADSRNISTLPIPKTAGNIESTPYLILGSQQKILKQGLKIWNDYKVLYHSTNESLFVRGVGLHVDQDFIIFSDSSGNIRKISSDGRELKTVVNRRNTLPSSLSVDWLNDLVYVVEESKVKNQTVISRCDFHSGLCKDVVFGFKTRATCVHVDPYNGYLYWIWTSDSEGGLYRIGLDKIATQAVNEKYCDQILKNSTLTTLSLDHKNYRL
ncbi:proto-oncogene tyrosine-protein kinase ROS-like isoform X1 [Tachypleus tridentatus]|uniref:proto-oncogene tyrosine-protein kinase ROS-like isoform X1 n=1 Tax=Tachypleus tridentatus TaxID=6853 RepID=UPI003FCFC8A2